MLVRMRWMKSLIFLQRLVFSSQRELRMTLQLMQTFLLRELFWRAYRVLMTGEVTYFSSCLAFSLKKVWQFQKFQREDLILRSIQFWSSSIILPWRAMFSARLRSHSLSISQLAFFFQKAIFTSMRIYSCYIQLQFWSLLLVAGAQVLLRFTFGASSFSQKIFDFFLDYLPLKLFFRSSRSLCSYCSYLRVGLSSSFAVGCFSTFGLLAIFGLLGILGLWGILGLYCLPLSLDRSNSFSLTNLISLLLLIPPF